MLNFEKNQVSRSKDFTLFQSYSRIIHTDYKYFHHNTLYYYTAEKKNYDSLDIDLEKFELLNFPIYNNELSTWIPWSISICILLSLATWFYYRRKKLPLLEQAISDASTQNIEEEKNESLAYTDSERNLIELLIQKSKSQETATLAEINYVLGVKDKNVGLQKKVRSDVINSINKKYKSKTGEASPWIQSVRSESDKRYFEYYIDYEK